MIDTLMQSDPGMKARFDTLPDELALASACSGTGAFELVGEAIADKLSAVRGKPVKVAHQPPQTCVVRCVVGCLVCWGWQLVAVVGFVMIEYSNQVTIGS